MTQEDPRRQINDSRRRLIATLEQALASAQERMRQNATLARDPDQRPLALERMREAQGDVDRITRDLAKIRGATAKAEAADDAESAS